MTYFEQQTEFQTLEAAARALQPFRDAINRHAFGVMGRLDVALAERDVAMIRREIETARAGLADANRPKPAPLPPPPAQVSLAAAIRHEPRDAEPALALRLGALRVVLNELAALSWLGEVTPAHRRVMAAGTGIVIAGDMIGALPALQPRIAADKFGSTGHVERVGAMLGVPASLTGDAYRREMIARLDRLAAQLVDATAWLGLVWTLKLRESLAGPMLPMLGAADDVVATWVELVGRQLSVGAA